MGGLFGGRVSQNAPRIASLQLTTSCWGGPIPIAYGRCRIAPNLVWQGDFKAIANSQSSGGKGGAPKSISYTYQTAIVLALCEGQVSVIFNTWDGRAVHGTGLAGAQWLDEYGNVLAQGSALGDFGLTLNSGAVGQQPWVYLTINHPTQALGYSGLAYLSAPVYQLDTSGSLPQQTFDCQCNLSGGPGGSIQDARIDEVFFDLLTNALYGAGFPSAQIGSLTQMANYCLAQGLWVSPVYTDQTTGSDVLKNLMMIANCGAFFSEGLIKVVPYGEQALSANGATYTPVTTAIYSVTDDDFVVASKGADPVTVDRSSPVVSYNAAQIRYRDRINQYNDAIAEKKDDASVALLGLHVANEIDCPEICDPNVAHTLAQILLQRFVYLRATYKFRLGWRFCLVEPMDLLTLTESTGSGLNGVTVRVTKVTENEDNTFDFEAEDFLGVCTGVLYNYQAPGGYATNYNVDPGVVTAPVIFEPPSRLTFSGQSEIWIAVTGTNLNLYAGATVWESLTGSSYKIAKTTEGRARFGVTTTLLPLTADPDTTDSLGIDLTVSGGIMLSATQQECDSLQTICLVDNEVIGYQSATLTAPFKYTLGTRLRRGLFGTQITQHQIGARFVRLDSAIVPIPYDASLVGSTVHFKFTAFNIFNSGEESIANVTDYPYTLQGPPGQPMLAPSGGWTSKGSQLVSGNTCFKFFNAATSWDSISYTNASYLNGVALSAQVTSTAFSTIIGLATSPVSAQAPNTWESIDFALVMYGTAFGGPTLAIFEKGVQVTTPIANFGSFKVGDTVQVTYDGRTIRYYIGFFLLRAVQAPGLTLYGAVTLYDPEASLSSIEFNSTASSPFEAGNFLSNLSWRIGFFGSQMNFIDNYDGSHNDSIVLLAGTTGAPIAGPSGSSEPLWVCTGNGSAQNGGWSNSGDLQGLDPTKTYRTSVWVYRSGPASGNFLFGADPNGATSDSPGVIDTVNATFLNTPISSFNAGEWYLAVGVIHGANYLGNAFGVAGLYRQLTGQQVVAGTEYQQTPNVTHQMQRAQFNAANSPSSFLYLTKPRFEEMNGTEPTILSLLGVVGTQLISQNGATEVFQFYGTGGSIIGPIGDTNQHITGAPTAMAFGAGVLPTFDCTVIVTVVFEAHITTLSSGTVKIVLGYCDAQQTTNPALYTQSSASVSLTTTSTIYTLQWQFEHTAGNVTGSDCSAIYQSTDAANAFEIGDSTLQLEFIKR